MNRTVLVVIIPNDFTAQDVPFGCLAEAVANSLLLFFSLLLVSVYSLLNIHLCNVRVPSSMKNVFTLP